MTASEVLVAVLADWTGSADRREVAGLLHQVAREGGWALGPTDRNDFRSFDFTPMTRGGKIISVMELHDMPALAVALGTPEYMRITFVDDAAVAIAAELVGLRYLPASELDREITEADRTFLTSLGARWTKDLKYWNPQAVGEVLFNWWD